MKTKLQNVIRQDSLSQFGFGLEAMKKLAVCPSCHSLENSDNTVCSICNSALTKSTLYDLYKSNHTICSKCETVISKGMRFCPRCGQALNSKTATHSV